MGGACGMYGERRGAYGGLEGKFEGKRPRGRSRLRWEILLNRSESNGMGGHGLG